MTDQLPTARELEALKVLWERQRCTVREIYDEMNTRSDLAYTTVLSLLQTMERKGLVERETAGRGKTHYYNARLKAEPTLRGLAGEFLDTVFEGAMSQYLVRALESRSVTSEELEEMEALIAEKRRQLG